MLWKRDITVMSFVILYLGIDETTVNILDYARYVYNSMGHSTAELTFISQLSGKNPNEYYKYDPATGRKNIIDTTFDQFALGRIEHCNYIQNPIRDKLVIKAALDYFGAQSNTGAVNKVYAGASPEVFDPSDLTEGFLQYLIVHPNIVTNNIMVFIDPDWWD